MAERSGPPLLVVGHGSRVALAAEEMSRLVDQVRHRVQAPVAHGWIELADPPAVDAARELVRETGANQLVVQPLLLFGAYHASVDVPAVAQALGVSAPRVRVRTGRALGLHPSLVRLAGQRVHEAAGAPDRDTGLLVVSSGSSDPDAQSQAATAARMVAERTGHDLVRQAFASVAAPGVEEAVAGLAADGAARVVVFSWSLLAGRLLRGAHESAQEAALDHGVEVVFAGRFGADPVVADVVVERYRQAVAR